MWMIAQQCTVNQASNVALALPPRVWWQAVYEPSMYPWVAPLGNFMHVHTVYINYSSWKVHVEFALYKCIYDDNHDYVRDDDDYDDGDGDDGGDDEITTMIMVMIMMTTTMMVIMMFIMIRRELPPGSHISTGLSLFRSFGPNVTQTSIAITSQSMHSALSELTHIHAGNCILLYPGLPLYERMELSLCYSMPNPISM